MMKDEEEWNKLLADIQTSQPEEGTLLIPHPSEATDAVGEFNSFSSTEPLLSRKKINSVYMDANTIFFSYFMYVYI